jgi:hypothetical protein
MGYWFHGVRSWLRACTWISFLRDPWPCAFAAGTPSLRRSALLATTHKLMVTSHEAHGRDVTSRWRQGGGGPPSLSFGRRKNGRAGSDTARVFSDGWCPDAGSSGDFHQPVRWDLICHCSSADLVAGLSPTEACGLQAPGQDSPPHRR